MGRERRQGFKVLTRQGKERAMCRGCDKKVSGNKATRSEDAEAYLVNMENKGTLS